jgi:hypothetical protein
LSDFDVKQCATDTDCNFLDSDIQRCEDGLCKAGCTNNRQCAAADPRYPICPALGETCVELTTEDGACTLSSNYYDVTMGGFTAEELLVIGAFAPGAESAEWLTMLLGARQIEQRGGLASASGLVQPTLLVTCDDDADNVDVAIDHLLTDLRARAIIANLEDRALASALDRAQSRGSALFLSPMGTNYAPPDPVAPFSWSLAAPVMSAAPAYPALIRRAVESVGGAAFWRLLFLVGDSREDGTLAEAVFDALQVDGKPSSELVREDHLRVVNLENDSIERRALQLADLVADFPPNVVVSFASGRFADADRRMRTTSLSDIESLASALGVLPIYLVGPRNASDSALIALALSDASVRARIVGVSADPPSDVVLGRSLASTFALAYPEADASLTLQGSTYDALYLSAYALAAAPHRSGDAIAEDVLSGLSRITTAGAPPVVVGPGYDGLDLAGELLAVGSPMDVHGSTGPVRFDSTRARTGAIRVYCLDGGGERHDVATFDPTSGSGDGLTLTDDWLLGGCGTEVLRANAD